ncbi:MAG: type II toxin-antitoxin system HicA family toxin [Acidobacteria bacterium]|nr:type II toxin-antitoxin system HicA family toxin [Acidobacteriota bacterium]
MGKGSHGRLHVDGRFTTVPRKEIGKGLLAAMLRDLDMDKEAF